MREILFRGKTDKGEWVYGVPFNEDERCYIIEDLFICDEYACTGAENSIVIPETIGQYTGLTDKNGKKIFEGDILKATDESGKIFIYKVVFINGIFGLVVKNGGYACALVLWTKDCIEVIGNIHDNPELLKSEVTDNESIQV